MASKILVTPSTPVALSKVRRQKNNENAIIFFAAAVLGLIAGFIALRCFRLVSQRRTCKIGSNITIFRKIHAALLTRTVVFPSIGHLLVFLIYLSVNITLSVTNMDWSNLYNWAKRLGWLSVANIALLTFLGLKNTPLGFLTAYTYERLQVLHQAAGYTTIMLAMLHGVVYIDALNKIDRLEELLEFNQIMGITGVIAMLVILLSALTMRRLHYEFFYILHIAMFLLILIVIGMHRPLLATKSLIIIIFAACIWMSDRILRASRLAYNALGNEAIITPLPLGGVRINLKKTPFRAVPGSHVLIWIPAIRAFETHPFTVVSVNPLESVVKAHDGFTKALSTRAISSPGATLRASAEGPYGKLPDFYKFDHTMLIAGGSGASFTFGIALEVLKQMEHLISSSGRSVPRIDFVWVVRKKESLSHFPSQLNTLASASNVVLTIHATHSTSTFATSSLFLYSPQGLKGNMVNEHSTFHGSDSSIMQLSLAENEKSDEPFDVEKSAFESSASSVPASYNGQVGRIIVHAGRPGIPNLVRSAVRSADDHQRVVVAACGPLGIINSVRSTVVEILKTGDGPSVEMYLETFGW